MVFHPIVKECFGCARIMEEDGIQKCKAYTHPNMHWRHGGPCGLATHVRVEEEAEQGKKRVGQQKHGRKG